MRLDFRLFTLIRVHNLYLNWENSIFLLVNLKLKRESSFNDLKSFVPLIMTTQTLPFAPPHFSHHIFSHPMQQQARTFQCFCFPYWGLVFLHCHLLDLPAVAYFWHWWVHWWWPMTMMMMMIIWVFAPVSVLHPWCLFLGVVRPGV